MIKRGPQPRWGKHIGQTVDLIDSLLFACQQIHSIPVPLLAMSIAIFRHPSFALPNLVSKTDSASVQLALLSSEYRG